MPLEPAVQSHSLRVDLLLLAPAVAGLLLLWGTEQAWVFRREIAALPLAWPWPFAVALGPAIERADVHVIRAASRIGSQLGAPAVDDLAAPSPLAVAATCLVAAWLAHPLRLWRRGVDAVAFASFGLAVAVAGRVVAAVADTMVGHGAQAIACVAAGLAVASVPAVAVRTAAADSGAARSDSAATGLGPHRRGWLTLLTATIVSVAAVASAALVFSAPGDFALNDAYGRARFAPMGAQAVAPPWERMSVPDSCAVYAAAMHADPVVGRRVIRTHTVSLDPGASNYRNCREALAPFVPDAKRTRSDAPGGVELETQRGPAFTGVRTAALVSWVWPVLDGEHTRYERVVLAAYDENPSALSEHELDQVTDRLESEALALIAARVAAEAEGAAPFTPEPAGAPR